MLLISKMVSCLRGCKARRLALMLTLACALPCAAADAPGAEHVLQQGFPSQPAALETLSDALFQEYETTGNLASLIFYSYSILNLANHFERMNDLVRAAEFAKTGFFYLDEAVDAHEDSWRVRYLRARLDAYLPEKLGRCVITLADTQVLLADPQRYDESLLAQVKYMRYRALAGCHQAAEQAQLRGALRQGSAEERRLLAEGESGPMAWSTREVADVLLPLMGDK